MANLSVKAAANRTVVFLEEANFQIEYRQPPTKDAKTLWLRRTTLVQRIPLGGGLQAPDNWIRYGVPVARLATGHPRRKGNAVDTLTVITSAPRR